VTGLYGKMPAHGDFVRRNLPRSFVAPWDEWLQEAIAAARDALEDRFDTVWDAAPTWRFRLPPGACGPDASAGVLAPSEDMVGRRFPLTLAALLAPGAPMPAEAWFATLEGLAATARAGDEDADMLVAAMPAEPWPGEEPDEPSALWWTEGGVRLLAPGLPSPEEFARMLDVGA
jgi:type VI secretion system protein ImpM